MLYVIGHLKPDLDSIVSAIVYAEILQQEGRGDVTAARSGEINNETKYILEKFEAEAPKLITTDDIKKNDQVILVDHNEENQRLENLDPDKIIEIIDHHKPNINFKSPIKIDIEPFGSTSTILFLRYLSLLKQLTEQKKLASLLLCAILSDTVGLKSATTTDIDKQTTQKLAKIAEINDINALSLKIFKAKSNIGDLTPEQMVKNDYKIFDFGGNKVFIGQVETIEQNRLLKKLKKLIGAMEKIKTEENCDFIYLALTDILQENTKLIFSTKEEKQLAEKAFDRLAPRSFSEGGVGDSKNFILDIGPRLSRKKEIAPEIEKAIVS